MNLSYNPGHPWYYVLEGKTLSIKEVWAKVQNSDYRGYRASAITRVTDNNSKLRKIQFKVKEQLKEDVHRYRQCVFDLHQFRKQNETQLSNPKCEDVHVSVSLKYCHLLNEFAHLKYIDEELAKRPELFDLL